jgi:hypothetical protein
MKLYSKKLNSLADIERERRRLVKEKEQMEADGLIDSDELIGGLTEAGSMAGAGIAPIITGLVTKYVPFAAPFAGQISGFAENWLARRSEQNATSQENSTGKKVKAALVTAGKDIVFSYLKWKAIELSYKGVNKLLEKRKEKKATK